MTSATAQTRGTDQSSTARSRADRPPADRPPAGHAPAGHPPADHSEELIVGHLSMVGHLVRELLHRLPAHVNRDDLVSAGMAALVGAARSFDPAQGVPFPRYARVRVRGALLDELRNLDWASRAVRSRARRLETARQELTATLHRDPTRAELADAIGGSVAEVDAVHDDIQRAVVLSLHGFTAGATDNLVVDSDPGPEERLLHEERLIYLRAAVEALPARLRAVVEGYFLHERPMAELAAELGVTESRISQLRAEALVLLRDGMNAQFDPVAMTQAAVAAGCVARRRHAYYTEVARRAHRARGRTAAA